MIDLILFYRVIFMLWVDFWPKFAVDLKQLVEKLKGDIWLLDYLIKPNITSSRKKDLYVRMIRMQSKIINLD